MLNICYHRLSWLLSWHRNDENGSSSMVAAFGCRFRSMMILVLLFLALVAIQQFQTMSHSTSIETIFDRKIVNVQDHDVHINPSRNITTFTFTDPPSDLSTESYSEDNVSSAPSPNVNSAPFKIYSIPKEPMYSAQSMVEEAIGPEILQDTERNPLRNCSVSVQFRLILAPPYFYGPNTSWVLQSMMAAATHVNTTVAVPKTYGGDELYVEWQSSVSSEMGVAHVTDRNDGTYVLEFVRPPIQQSKHSKFTSSSKVDVGRLTIYYDYCCWIGGMFAPQKNEYARAGEIHTFFSQERIPRPYIQDFVPPNQDRTIDLSAYDTVISFGDSLMQQFARRFSKGKFWSPNLIHKTNVCQCLSDPLNDVDALLKKFHAWHGDYVLQAVNNSQRVAVITGSAVWDAMRGCVRSDFRDHIAAIRSFVLSMQSQYPNLDLIWKSPSAVLLHRRGSLNDLLNNSQWMQNSRYMSDAIPRQLYAVQKDLIEELKIPLLDLWEAYYLSGPWTIPGDGRHYQDDISFLLLSYYWPGLTVKPEKRITLTK
jgi:hypothetical protein